MPATRSPVRKIKTFMDVNGLYFAAGAKKPELVSVCTLLPESESSANPRFPVVEHILGASSPPHDCSVTVFDRFGRPYKYIIYFQYDQGCGINTCLKGVLRGFNWRGDILVMKQGERRLVTSILAGKERFLATVAIKKFLLQAVTHIEVANSSQTAPSFPTNI